MSCLPDSCKIRSGPGVSGVRCQDGWRFQASVFSPAARRNAASLIEKETDERRSSNVQHRTSNECILSVLKRFREAIPHFEIRYSLFEILRFAV